MSLELIFGPMFSGKTTELLRRIGRHRIAGQWCIVLTPPQDVRSGTDRIGLHSSQETFGAVTVSTLREALTKDRGLGEVDVIGIDEGQFFPDLDEGCLEFLRRGKKIIVAALDLTFARKPFGRVPFLACHATRVDKLTAVCVDCGSEAAYSKRIAGGGEEIEIGGKDKYKAVCTRCFNKL